MTDITTKISNQMTCQLTPNLYASMNKWNALNFKQHELMSSTSVAPLILQKQMALLSAFSFNACTKILRNVRLRVNAT